VSTTLLQYRNAVRHLCATKGVRRHGDDDIDHQVNRGVEYVYQKLKGKCNRNTGYIDIVSGTRSYILDTPCPRLTSIIDVYWDYTRAISAAAEVVKTGTIEPTSGGTYTGTTKSTYYVEIDFGEPFSHPNTFKWKKDAGAWTGGGTQITGLEQTIAEGVTVTFDATTGGIAGDNWTISVQGAWDLEIPNCSATELYRLAGASPTVLNTPERYARDGNTLLLHPIPITTNTKLLRVRYHGFPVWMDGDTTVSGLDLECELAVELFAVERILRADRRGRDADDIERQFQIAMDVLRDLYKVGDEGASGKCDLDLSED